MIFYIIVVVALLALVIYEHHEINILCKDVHELNRYCDGLSDIVDRVYLSPLTGTEDFAWCLKEEDIKELMAKQDKSIYVKENDD